MPLPHVKLIQGPLRCRLFLMGKERGAGACADCYRQITTKGAIAMVGIRTTWCERVETT